MRIALAITSQYPLQLPKGVIFASIPLHLMVAKGLAERGHEVTIFCSEDTQIEPPLKKVSTGLPSVYALRKANPDKDYGYKYVYTSDLEMFAKMIHRANAGDFDLIWSNDPTRVAALSSFTKVPSLFTLHDPLDRQQYHLLPALQKECGNHFYVSISNAQRVPLPELEYIRTIYHGFDVHRVPFEPNPEDYFVYFGRLIPEKAIHDSIAVAKKAGVKLKLIGSFDASTPARQAYKAQVEALIDGEQIEYLGEMTFEELVPVVSKARGFINMIEVRESFGMVLVEAMAMGVPVVARNRGSIPEVITDGETGFVVETVDQAVEVLQKIDSIDRAACRRHVEQSFGVARYIDEYEQVMQEALNKAHTS